MPPSDYELAALVRRTIPDCPQLEDPCAPMRTALTGLAGAVLPLAAPREDGEAFVFGAIAVYGAPGAPWTTFLRARRRIVASLTGRALFAALEADTSPTIVLLDPHACDDVDYADGRICWNPHGAGASEDGALRLALLLGAIRSTREAPVASAAAKATADDAFGTAWTRHIAERWERPLVRDLGARDASRLAPT